MMLSWLGIDQSVFPTMNWNNASRSATCKSSLSGSKLPAGNNSPLVATFNLGEGAVADVSTRIKMGKTGDVVAVVKSGGKLFANRKSVKVTIGGCGG